MAIGEINADGPPLRLPLRLVVSDPGASPARSVLKARRLVEWEGCPVVIAGTICPAFDAARAVLRDQAALLAFGFPNEGGRTGHRLIRLGERPDAQLAGA